ncbi:glycosyltransferase [Chloroflexota bacterium]
MKILAVVSTLDLKYHLGCTPAWWQLFKALHETGNEIITVPYLGDPVESLWWRTYSNPCSFESKTFNWYLEQREKSGVSPSKRNIFSPIIDSTIKHYIKPKWEKRLLKILNAEKSIDVVFFMNVPINHIFKIPSRIKKANKIPVVYYDGDMPTILPQYTVSRGFKFDCYQGADLSEYDAFFTNSEGCIPDLEKMGAKNIQPLHYGADPELCSPLDIDKDIDVFFFGYGSDFREEWMNKLITLPSKNMPGIKFVIGGSGFKIDLGKTERIGDLSYNEWRKYACRSKINLNITRWSHTNIYASSTSRLFELAAFGACIVSQPYNGLEKWFDIGKEIFIVNDEKEAIDVYNNMLESEDLCREVGNLARQRVIKEHTFKHRAKQLSDIIGKL